MTGPASPHHASGAPWSASETICLQNHVNEAETRDAIALLRILAQECAHSRPAVGADGVVSLRFRRAETGPVPISVRIAPIGDGIQETTFRRGRRTIGSLRAPGATAWGDVVDPEGSTPTQILLRVRGAIARTSETNADLLEDALTRDPRTAAVRARANTIAEALVAVAGLVDDAPAVHLRPPSPWGGPELLIRRMGALEPVPIDPELLARVDAALPRCHQIAETNDHARSCFRITVEPCFALKGRIGTLEAMRTLATLPDPVEPHGTASDPSDADPER